MPPDSAAQFINRHSFVISALILWGVLALALVRPGPRGRRRGLLALAAASAVLAGVWLALRSGPGTMTEAAQVEAVVGQGQPVLVEFYSDY